MPLLKGRVLSPVKSPINNIGAEDTVYVIPHTSEKFRSKEEYEKRLALYEDAVWTCQCTGAIKLTYKQAMDSESKIHSLLKEQFPTIFEKSILEAVHNSTAALDNLVDETWRQLHEHLVLNEPVTLKVRSNGKLINGSIAKVNKTTNVASPEVSKTDTSESKTDSPKKPPKLVPCKYGVKLDNEDKIINSIPVDDLQRVTKAPKKDLIKLFIRSHAVRVYDHLFSQWVVDEDLVKKYSLPPSTMVNGGSKSNLSQATTSPKKRKMWPVDENLKPVKKLKLHSSGKTKKTSGLNDGKQTILKLMTSELSLMKMASPKNRDSTSPKENVNPNKKSPKKTPSGSRDDASSTDVPLAVLKNKGLDEEGVSLAQVKVNLGKSFDSGTNTKKETKPKDSKNGKLMSSPKVTLYKLTSPKDKLKKNSDPGTASPKRKFKQITLYELNTSKKSEKTPSKTPQKTPSKTPQKTPVKMSAKTPVKTPVKTLVKTPQKNSNSNKSSKGSDKRKFLGSNKMQSVLTPKKNLSLNKTPMKSTPKKMLPPIVAKLQKFMQGDKSEKNVRGYKQILGLCAKTLNISQITTLPDDLKNAILPRYNALQEKKRLEAMTPAEKEEFIAKKREAAREMMKKRQEAENKRYEDLELDLKPLPSSKIVSTPDGLANELFGDVAMVTEFVNCYKELLMPDQNWKITSDDLMTALVSGKDGFGYLSRVLCILLQTLMQDQLTEDYKELKTPLSKLALNEYTVSELVRLCLRKQDLVDEDDKDDDDDEDEDDASFEDKALDDVVVQLETSEYYELEVQAKLQILVGLCHRIMASYSIEDYIEKKQQEASQLWKKKLKESGEKKEKQSKGKKKETNEEEKPKDPEKVDDNQPTEKSKGLTIDHFYGDKKAETTQNGEGGSDDDLVLAVKRRRMAVEERKIKEVQEQQLKEKEIEIYRQNKEKELREKNFEKASLLAKRVIRHSPVGVDRNHSRYWIFHGSKFGLYVEKGWVSTDIEYCVQKTDESSSSEPVGQKAASEEKSIPHVGQNLWFVYDTVEDIKSLIDSLHPLGIRESSLKKGLQKQLDQIIYTFTNKHVRVYDNPAVVVEGSKSLAEGLQQEMIDLGLRLEHGGLCSMVPDFQVWEGQVLKAKEIGEFADCLLQLHSHIYSKFLTGMMDQGNKNSSSKSYDSEKETDDAEKETAQNEDNPDEKLPVSVKKWMEALHECPTFSRFQVLMEILDSCIKWEKSAQDAKCKICRKKNDEDNMLLCDDCNQAFHLFCLRPILFEVPDGEWFCPACKPQRSERKRRVDYCQNKADSDDDDEESENSDSDYAAEIKHEQECAICGVEEELVPCTTCPSSFHLDCHDPPLRHIPRAGTFRCMQCKSGVRIKKSHPSKKSKKKGKKSGVKKLLFDVSKKKKSASKDDEDLDDRSSRAVKRKRVAEESEGSDDSDGEARKRPTKQNNRQNRQSKKCKVESSDESEQETKKPVTKSRGQRWSDRRNRSENLNESESEQEPKTATRRSNGQQKSRQKNKMEDSDETDTDTKRRTTRQSNGSRKSGGADDRIEDSEVSDEEVCKRATRRSKEPRKSNAKDESEEESDSESEQPASSKRNDRARQLKTKSKNKASELSFQSTKQGKISRKSVEKGLEKRRTSRLSYNAESDTEPEMKPRRSSTQAEKLTKASKLTKEDKVLKNKELILRVIDNLQRNRHSWPFLEPVDASEVPDYYTLVKKPIDLATMENKCISEIYVNPQQFVDDFTLMLRNAEQYNEMDSYVGKCIIPMEKCFAGLVSRLFPTLKYKVVWSASQ